MFYIWYGFEFGLSSSNGTVCDDKTVPHRSVIRFYITVKRTHLSVNRT
jgi:hypothetical protein